MESVIKWKTDLPDIEGEYLVTDDNGNVTVDCWCVLEHCQYWAQHRNDEVIAWCKLSDIEPCKLFAVGCGNGWNKLLKPIFDYIENYNKDKDDKDKIEVLQVKEKFGTLRFYTSFYTDELHELINKAENESAHTCELCGSKENIGYTCRWITTCCEKCAKEIAKRNKKTVNWRPLNIGKGYKWIEIHSDGTQKPIEIQTN